MKTYTERQVAAILRKHGISLQQSKKQVKLKRGELKRIESRLTRDRLVVLKAVNGTDRYYYISPSNVKVLKTRGGHKRKPINEAN